MLLWPRGRCSEWQQGRQDFSSTTLVYAGEDRMLQRGCVSDLQLSVAPEMICLRSC